MQSAPPTSSRAVLVVLLACLPGLGLAMPPASGAAAKRQPRAGVLDVRLKDGKKVGLFDSRSAATPVARVGDEVITVRDLAEAIAEAHGVAADGGGPDLSSILDRLIDVRLIISEARTMGIDEMPQFKAEVERFTESALRDQVRRRVAARAKVDPMVVERRYKEAVREWKVTSLLFEKEADAKEVAERIQAGGSFDELAARALADKRAKARQDGEFVRDSKLLPEVAAAVRTVPEGTVSGATRVTGGFALLRVDGVRYPDDPEVRENVEAEVRNAAQLSLIMDYTQALVKKHARIDKKLLAALDYDGAGAPLEKLAKDRRVVARIPGEKDVTVADLTAALEKKNFHGAKQASESKRLNKDKEPILRAMLSTTLLLRDARQKRLQDTTEVKYLVREKKNTLAFAALLERVIVPEVKVAEDDIKAYYERHRDEFTYPAMYRLEGLAFADASSAQTAVKKLRAGTDFRWLRTNAEGQVDPAKQRLEFGDLPVAASTLPPEFAAAIAGTKPGDYRTYAQDGVHYVVRTIDSTEPGRRPLDDVRETIQKKVFGEKVEAALGDWTRKLREHYPVEVLLASAG